MAAGLLGDDKIAALCLGKPALRSLSVVSATVVDAIAALNSGEDTAISVWSCDHSKGLSSDVIDDDNGCVCIGKICMVDIISYLCKQQNLNLNLNQNLNRNLSSPNSLALAAPLSVLLSQIPRPIRHVQPSSSVVEAIDLMVQGVQNLVVPIERIKSSRRKLVEHKTSPIITTVHHNGQQFCWLTQEDVMRYLLGSIGLFSPLPALSIHVLGIITAEFSALGYHSPAASAVEALSDQISVAVVDDDGVLIREISPAAVSGCDVTAAAAVAALSAGDLSQCAIVCHPGSSLAAVMIQAIAHRVNYVWVIEDDWSLVGIVTFSNIFGVFREYLESKEESEI